MRTPEVLVGLLPLEYLSCLPSLRLEKKNKQRSDVYIHFLDVFQIIHYKHS